MGLEARCKARFGKKISDGKAHLDSLELRFRGDFRLSIPLKQVKSADAGKGRLKVSFPDGTAVFHLGSSAEKWALKIRYPKSLIDKLGVKAESKISVLGVQDPDFRKQLEDRAADVSDRKPRKDSDLIFVLAEKKQDLKRLKTLQAYIKKSGALWVVSPKGKDHIKQSDVMAAGKKCGLVDTKVVSFSETHSALKMMIPLARR